MNPHKFLRIAESLRQYRRADLRDFQKDLGGDPVDSLYVDPLPAEAVLKSVLSSSTTFLLGRKGTGKSTVFAKAQSVYRSEKSILSVYVDVKSLYEILPAEDIQLTESNEGIDVGISRCHMLRKSFLGAVISELLKEIEHVSAKMNMWDRWKGLKQAYKELQADLEKLAQETKETTLESHEIPILQKISRKWRSHTQIEQGGDRKVDGKAKISPTAIGASTSASVSDFDKTLEDAEVYKEYSEVVLQTYPFAKLLKAIKELIEGAGMDRLVVFFDDFSELNYLDQKLFVDVILSPLNNASNEIIKLKIAGYPGRVYYGKIDPSKVDTISLDFAALYETVEIQEMEASATDYATRLLKARFEAFGEGIEEYFDPATSIEDHMRLVFQTSFGVPRLIGALLHTCFLDRVSKGLLITQGALRLAARKYYESTILQYFDRMFRYALEPFENKLDRHNQKELLDCIIAESRDVRKNIVDGSVGGTYFNALGNPPTSHFVVRPNLESLFRSLEANLLVSKYKDTRNKNGDPVVVYALYYGLSESNRMSWGYPPGREYRNYFVQRCFDYSSAVQDFLGKKKTIRCDDCGTCYPMDNEASFELFKWSCPECKRGLCSVTILAEDFKDECASLDEELMLEPIEVNILGVLNDEDKSMRAGEIAGLLDVTYQLVGHRTSKLQELDLVKKEKDGDDGHMKSTISATALKSYFK